MWRPIARAILERVAEVANVTEDSMQEYWERRLDEARRINDRIEAELEVALASAGSARSAPLWQERRRADDAVERVEIVTPRTPHQLQISIFQSAPAGELPPTALTRRLVGPLWYRGLLAGMYSLASNFVLYAGLSATGALDRISTAASLPVVLAVTSVLCALTGTVAFGVTRSWFARPDVPFRFLTAVAVLVLLVAFVVTPGATYLGAIVAVVMTSMSLGSDLVSD